MPLNKEDVIESEYTMTVMQDSTVYAMMRMGASDREIIIALAKEKARLLNEIVGFFKTCTCHGITELRESRIQNSTINKEKT